VVARDPTRDLAVIRVDSVPEYAKAVPLAEQSPSPGDAVHAMNHPGGLEFAWIYSAGTVRQLGGVALADGDQATRVPVTVLQLPAQAGSPGGPVLNARGELLGVLSSRESAQHTGYAATPAEVAHFLDVALVERPARTVEGVVARAEVVARRLPAALAEACALRALDHRQSGRLREATRDCRTALALDPGCTPASLCLAGVLTQTGEADAARAVLDFAADRGPFNDRVLLARAGVAMDRKEWRAARGDLERILDVNPADAVARRWLVGALLELGKDDEAATAVRDTLRADPEQLPLLATDLFKQAAELEKKFAEGVPAAWLARALGAAQAATTDAALKNKIEAALKRAAGAKDDAERLAILRAFTTTLTGK
jgi:tetratricopeptide (TPR) repeat protein